MRVVSHSVVAGATPSPEGSFSSGFYSRNLSCMVEPAGGIKPPLVEPSETDKMTRRKNS